MCLSFHATMQPYVYIVKDNVTFSTIPFSTLMDMKLQVYDSYSLFHTQWGYVVVTTPNGVLDHEEAIRQNVGGQVIGYFY